jgi:hypothetical protein
MSKFEVCMPTIDELEGCVDVRAVEDLGDKDDSGAVTFSGTIFFVVAPWLRDLIMDSGTFDPFKLIPKTFTAAKEFDREAANASPPFDEHERAITYGSDFALWAWSIGKGKIPSIQYTVRPEDKEMESSKSDGLVSALLHYWHTKLHGSAKAKSQRK